MQRKNDNHPGEVSEIHGMKHENFFKYMHACHADEEKDSYDPLQEDKTRTSEWIAEKEPPRSPTTAGESSCKYI